MLKRGFFALLVASSSGCYREPSSFALCSGLLNITTEISLDVAHNYARYSDLIGSVEYCRNSHLSCIEFPFPFSKPPNGFAAGTTWSGGRHTFLIRSKNDNGFILTAFENETKQFSVVYYDYKTGVERVVLPGGERLDRCRGRFVIEDMERTKLR